MLPEGAAFAVLMRDTSPEAIELLLAELAFHWHETLGLPPNADPATIRRAWARLARAYQPDTGGTQEQMARINAAYECARPP
jgi:DnaJ-domain-containing protein 1